MDKASLLQQLQNHSPPVPFPGMSARWLGKHQAALGEDVGVGEDALPQTRFEVEQSC